MPVRLGVTSDRLSVTLEGVSANKQVGWTVGWVEQTNGWKVSLGSVLSSWWVSLFEQNVVSSTSANSTTACSGPAQLSIYLGLESLIDQIPTI